MPPAASLEATPLPPKIHFRLEINIPNRPTVRVHKL